MGSKALSFLPGMGDLEIMLLEKTLLTPEEKKWMLWHPGLMDDHSSTYLLLIATMLGKE